MTVQEKWVARYKIGSWEHWQGRQDGPGAQRYHEAIQILELHSKKLPHAKDTTVALLGFCCDEGVRRNKGRPGAVQGPAAIRRALANVPAPQCPLFDAGDITCTDGDLEGAQEALSDAVFRLMEKGYHPVLMGGGHEIAWGHYRGIEKKHPKASIAIVNVDSHFDIRPLVDGKGSSGTSFLQIADARHASGKGCDFTCFGIQPLSNTEAMFQKANELHATFIKAEEFHHGKMTVILEAADNIVARSDFVYLTLCLDVFAAAFAPGVSSPQPLGLLPWEAIPLIQRFAASGKVAGFNVAELSPPLDRDNQTAQLAASVIASYIQQLVRR